MSTINQPTARPRSRAAIAAGILAALLATSLSAHADTIDYRFLGELQTTSFTHDGVTVTGGPGLVYVNLSNGLSIVGGNNYSVDPGEYLNFNFDSAPATGVSFKINGGPSAETSITAYGAGGADLGTQSASVSVDLSNIDATPPVDVSALFGNQAISSFSVATVSGAYRLDILNFTQSAVPDGGSTLLLLVLGLVALGAFGLLRVYSWRPVLLAGTAGFSE